MNKKTFSNVPLKNNVTGINITGMCILLQSLFTSETLCAYI